MPEITLPTLHAGQVTLWQDRARFNAVCCGRRWGKTKDLITKAGNACARGEKVGVFTPEYKQWSEIFDELKAILQPIRTTVNKSDGVLRTGFKNLRGFVDFWSVNDNELAGRGREYDLILGDEMAFTKNKQMLWTWKKAIRPTLLTTRGDVWMYSTPNGNDPENFFYAINHDEKLGFKQHHAPTNTNPYVPLEEFELERLNNHPLVFEQEFLAKFVDWSGVAFFSLDKLTVLSLTNETGRTGVPWPMRCDAIFAVIDSALKDGSENDGTAVKWFAITKGWGVPLVVLDWEILQIKADMLNTWLPSVAQRGEQLAKICECRGGFIGGFIEDKGSGIALNQYAQRVGLPFQPIQGDITSIGKDGRAIMASGAVHREEVKYSAHAYDKVLEFKGQTRNHSISQVCGYRIGDKDAAKRADDLADCFTYGIILGLNGADGF
jgi:hypothetical protein